MIRAEKSYKKACKFCGSNFTSRRKDSEYCKKSCRTLYSASKRFRITEEEFVRAAVDYDKSLAAGKPVRSFEAIRRFLIDRGILIEGK